MRSKAPSRRGVLLGAAALGLGTVSAGGNAWAGSEQAFAASPVRKLNDADWRKRLPPAAYGVLRKEDTERPGTSPLLNEHRQGVFACLGCELPLFRSAWKYDSHTGWPSFFRVVEANVGQKLDLRIGIPRTEYHCARCLGHQGHLFHDGPPPTGLRYCNNGLALKFVPT